MKRNLLYTFLVFLISFGLSSGCVKENTPGPDDIQNLVVVSDTINLLTARVHFDLAGFGEVQLHCEPETGEQTRPIKVIKRVNQNSYSFDLLGLQENTRYVFRIVSQDGQNQEILHEGFFTTAAIPQWLVDYLPDTDHRMNIDGLILLNTFTLPPTLTGVPVVNYPASAFLVVDPSGKLILARVSNARISAVRYTQRGTFLSIHSDFPNTSGSNHIIETTLAGDTILHLVYGHGGFDRMVHHDMILTDDHHIIAITESSVGGVKVDGLMRLDRSGNKIWEWDTSDIIPVTNQPYIQPWGNSISFDNEGNFIVSFRNIHQVWKLHKDTRQVIWRLGKNGTIPLSGNNMFLTQHMAQFIEPNRLMLFDNGQDVRGRIVVSNDHRPYSRIAFYDFNADQTQILNSSFINLPEKYFTWAMGSVIKMGNTYLVGSSWPGYILHLDESGNILSELKFGSLFYRAVPVENFLD
ncbi:MAG TPA: aryl-sulfate sulfotransferase [Bacteroidales bacterium]|nr:aryl-sulfate sulfotransferase [Bacteroidales bacterium]